MKDSIHVIENFYNNADGVREYLLKASFNVTGNFPGFRTQSNTNDGTKKYFEKIIGKEITHFPTHSGGKQYNGAFQYTTSEMKTWIHRDCTSWAAIIYLTPNAPPSAGTAFFKHIETGKEEAEDKEIQKKMDRDSNDQSKWELVDFVGNKYNRCVIFRGKRSHKSMGHFGTCLEDGRLFQLFFFETIETYKKSEAVVPARENILKPALLQHITVDSKGNVSVKTDSPVKITILFFSTSRYEYLEPMLESFHSNVDFQGTDIHKILMCDYPLRRDSERLYKLKKLYGIQDIVLNEDNLGYSLAWKKAWNLVPEDTDFIWHQEEDFTFNKQVRVKDILPIFENSPIPLTQIVLKRQRWFPTRDFIESIETGKIGRQIQCTDTLNSNIIIHQHYFNSNPGLYPMWITKENYPHSPQESVIVGHLKQKYPDKYSCILGKIDDPPLIKHIGLYNQGKKVLEGEPGWDWLKNYDPEQKYNSRGYLQLFESE